MKNIQIALAGLGNVGCGVFKHLANNRPLIESRTGCSPVITRVAVRDTAKSRPVSTGDAALFGDWRRLFDSPLPDLFIELMGGTGEALEFTRAALKAGRPVITGNKALLAEHGAELFELSAECGAPLYFEAAAAGGIPIIKTVREALVGNHILSMHGIVNGTSNYILTRMAEEGLDFNETLAEAQRLGYAEADPALDINGWDAAHKAIILASLAYGFWVDHTQVYVEGIDRVTGADIRYAAQMGYTIKLLAIIKATPGTDIEVRVHPALVPKTHVLASVRGVFNAVAIHGDVVGDTLFYGRGAGPDATASAVLGDIADAAAALRCSKPAPVFMPHDLYGRCRPADEIVSQFYLRLAVEDKPGVLARIAEVLGGLGIGILSVIQPESREAGAAPLVLMLHDAPRKKMQQAVSALGALDCVKAPPHVLWVEHPSGS